MEVYHTPAIKWQYSYVLSINGYEYQFGDSMPMKTLEDAQKVLTWAVETHSHIPVNILGSLEGNFDTSNRFVGKILYADDLPDGNDMDEDTERYVEVTITCSEVRRDTVFGS